MIAEVVETLNAEQCNIEVKFSQMYDHSVVLAMTVETEPSMPRIAVRQLHCSNIQEESPK